MAGPAFQGQTRARGLHLVFPLIRVPPPIHKDWLLLSISIQTAMELASPSLALFPWYPEQIVSKDFPGMLWGRVRYIQKMPSGIDLRRDATDKRFGVWSTPYCNL